MIRTGDAILKFSPEVRLHLAGLGVIEQQVLRLEAILGVCRSTLRNELNSADLIDVRDEFNDLEKALEKAKEVVSRVLAAPESATARYETLERLTMEHVAIRTHGDSDDPLQSTLTELVSGLDLVRRARQRLGAERRTRRSAIFWPVKLIHEALVGGYGEAHVSALESGRPLKRVLGEALPHVPTTTPGSPFVQTVAACYQVVSGIDDYVPEKAIRSYVNWYRKQSRG